MTRGRLTRLDDYYSPYVQYLLASHSDEKAVMTYGDNFLTIEIPQIGPRPPYYTQPVYEPYMPVI